MSAPKPVVLCVLDGWGMRRETEANAVALARTPAFDRMMAECPNATLAPSGESVGLPTGQMGNSEVGHMNIGAGRVVWMDLPRIDKAIGSGELAGNARLADFMETLSGTRGVAHLAGLASPGGVHSHQRHIAFLANVIASRGIPVAVHAFLDGRDVAPKSALDQISELEGQLPRGARIATVSGRFYAMDRDRRWDRVEQAFDVMASASGLRAESAAEAIAQAYARGETDEFVTPTTIGPYRGMIDGDGLLFANFRADRARELLSALVDPAFEDFDPSDRPKFAAVCGMVEYSKELARHVPPLFPPVDIVNTIGAWLSGRGKKQLRLAETEKYPHVTFFMNGGVEEPSEGEDRYMAPSPKVRTYDLKPEMSAAEVTERLVGSIRGQDHDLIIVNFANPDMVGHTGNLKAAITACETVDGGVARALEALDAVGGAMILTADHGNCEMMIDPETGGPHTSHTLNPVPVVLIGGPAGASLRQGGRLSDLAPTLLELMQVPVPPEMTGQSLIDT
ncbi:MAG: 2,3-bisphosphoglycerate-independent phosphoglycerate mutase [Paracoccaceae bacterium]